MANFSFFAVLLLLANFISDTCCLHDDSTVLFGTKTAYKSVEDSLEHTRHPKLKTGMCKPTQLNIVARHGTRNPSKNDIKTFRSLERKINRIIKTSSGMSPDVKVKFPWLNPFKKSTEKLLVPVGDQELYGIGRRFAARFPEILAKPFSAEKFKFVSTCKRRCSESAAAFSLGYLQGKGHLTSLRLQPVPVMTRTCHGDRLLRFYDNCPKYKSRVKDNYTAAIEMEKFKQGRIVRSVIKKVKHSLGLKNSKKIDFPMVLAMYKMCAFSVAIFEDSVSQGWCSVFNQRDFKVLEYILDLNAYYTEGPFYAITSEISCGLLKDVVATLKTSRYTGVFRFAHSRTVFPLLTELGFLDKGVPLKADNYMKMKNRKFRSGLLVPFSGNIAFVKYQCQNRMTYVQAFVNEKLATFKCCKDPTLCTWKEFESCYMEKINSCNLNKYCSM